MKEINKKYVSLIKNRFVALIFSLCVVTIMVGAIILIEDSRETALANAELSNWGLSFQTEGETPIGNASIETLAEYNSFYVGDETQKKIYLSFDAGYENGGTDEILDILKEHEVSASFFLVGNYLDTEPELVKRMCEEGHTVGNHTWSHPDMSKISTTEEFKEELEKIEDKFLEITGQEMEKIYRPPQGKFSIDNLQMAKDMGYTTVFWSLAYVDWYENDQPTKEEAFEKLIPRIHNGAVVLLHSTSKTNVDILDELLIKWKEMGYTFGDINELISPAF